ncbi:MAG: hypothetical protein JNK85_19910 [Verrucomicrobiales bacterium]|nr:hypothetical protein [Verrucomicrobiales bacterium]
MVISRSSGLRRRAALTVELVIALAIFVMAFVPLGVLATREHRLARGLYYRAVAGEILDGELEVLLAGGWKALSPGTNALSVRAEATNSLPAGRFEAILDPPQLTVQWRANQHRNGGDTYRRGQVRP